MHLDHGVELLLGHREDHLVAQDPGVVHEHVELAERVDRTLDDLPGALEVGHVVAVGDGLAAPALDDVDDLVRGRRVGALTGDRAAEVVDHDLGAVIGERDGLAAADTVAGSRDDGDLAVEHAHLRVHPPGTEN